MTLFADEQVLEVSFWYRLVANSSYWLVLGSFSCCFHNMLQISVEWGQIADALPSNRVWIYTRQGSDQEERRNSFKYGAYCASCVRQVVLSARPASQSRQPGSKSISSCLGNFAQRSIEGIQGRILTTGTSGVWQWSSSISSSVTDLLCKEAEVTAIIHEDAKPISVLYFFLKSSLARMTACSSWLRFLIQTQQCYQQRSVL